MSFAFFNPDWSLVLELLSAGKKISFNRIKRINGIIYAATTETKSATTSRAGGMRMAPGRGRGHLCRWPLIF